MKSMDTYVALLRGINVGGRNILPMKDLVSLLEANSCCDVKTYIQSGNVVFKGSKKNNGNIGTLIEKKFKFKPEILILSEREFMNSIGKNPFQSDIGKEIHFYFCKTTPKPDMDKLIALKARTEKFEIKDKVFYLYAPDGIARFKLVASIDRYLGVPATGRNLNTINKLKDMIQND